MKRMIAFMMAMVLCMSMLAACGGSEGEAADGEIKGDVFDAGNVSALVPKGWKAFPVTDAWAEEEGAMDPNQVSICKDGDSEWDLFSKPYISLIYYGADEELYPPDSSWYDNPVDIEDIKLSNLTWEGYTADSFGVPMAILWADDGAGNEYQANIVLKTDEGEISLNDAEVLAILESVKPSK